MYDILLDERNNVTNPIFLYLHIGIDLFNFVRLKDKEKNIRKSSQLY